MHFFVLRMFPIVDFATPNVSAVSLMDVPDGGLFHWERQEAGRHIGS